MNEIVGWGYPHLALYCGKYIICTWIKMTCNYLLDLRKDIKLKNLPKMTPISFSGQIKCIQSVSSYCFHHFLMIFNKNTHTCKRNTIEIDEREYIQDIFIEQLSFSLIKVHRNKNNFLTEIYNGKCLHLFSIRNTLGIHRAIFQRYHPGLLQYKISVDITFLGVDFNQLFYAVTQTNRK